MREEIVVPIPICSKPELFSCRSSCWRDTGTKQPASRAEAVAVDTVLLNFVSQDSFGRVEQLRRPLAISASRLQRILNEVALVGSNCAIQRKPRDRARLFGSLERGREMMSVDYPSRANQHCALDDILQLAHVARPVITSKHVYRCG